MAPELSETETSVVVVGGSIVGLSAALFLHQHGIPVIVLERRSALSTHPRLQAASPRTMEILGAMGFAAEIRAAETPNACYGDIVQTERLAGPETARLEGPFPHDTYGVSATGWTLIGQDRLEPIVLKRLLSAGVPVLFDHELTGLEQGDESVLCHVRVDGRDSARFRAHYVIAADGHASTVRELLGIESSGPGALGEQSVILFDADLTRHVAGREFFICFVMNDRVRGALGRLGPPPNTRWCLAPHLPPGRPIEDYSVEECVALVRAAVGDDDLPVRVESTTRWSIAARVAEQYRAGRVFLAGDAAHVMPPTGGYGGNMGVADAHNLAWKLAYALRGVAGEPLLQTYQEERQGVALFTTDQALLRFRMRSAADNQDGSIRADEATVIFGQHYHTHDASSRNRTTSFADPRLISGLPGTRAPHIQLVVDGVGRDVHDLLNTDFVVLHGSTAWDVAAVLERMGVTGRAISLSTGSAEVMRERYGIDPGRGAVLIRPDGVIAWRTGQLTERGLEEALADSLQRVAVTE